MALSYWNSEEIPVYFEELYNKLSDSARILGDWLKDNYILGKNNRSPSFSPSFSSWADINEKRIPGTQNFAESFHHHFQQILSADYVGIYRDYFL
jgi:hypothetical protein